METRLPIPHRPAQPPFIHARPDFPIKPDPRIGGDVRMIRAKFADMHGPAVVFTPLLGHAQQTAKRAGLHRFKSAGTCCNPAAVGRPGADPRAGVTGVAAAAGNTRFVVAVSAKSNRPPDA